MAHCSKDRSMKKLVALVALGAAFVSTQALAQERGGGDETRQQALQKADQIFQRLDLNHDGVVTRAEAEQFRQQMGFGAGKAEKLIDRIFGTAQSITLKQFETQQLARFDRDDLNHDGVVTGAERQQARAQLKANRAAAAQATQPR
jgi:hypothetical protein